MSIFIGNKMIGNPFTRYPKLYRIIDEQCDDDYTADATCIKDIIARCGVVRPKWLYELDKLMHITNARELKLRVRVVRSFDKDNTSGEALDYLVNAIDETEAASAALVDKAMVETPQDTEKTVVSGIVALEKDLKREAASYLIRSRLSSFIILCRYEAKSRSMRELVDSLAAPND